MKTIEQRYPDRIKVGLPNECWEWQASKNKDGYGQVWIEQKLVRTHRLSYHLAHPDWLIDSEEQVLHKCDNPPCCNPNHLFPGTQLDNIRDRDKKNRQARQKGESCGRAKLTELEVWKVFEMKSSGLSGREIARQTGMSNQHISRILTKKAWNHLHCKEALE